VTAIVAGGGISGLAAATVLARAGQVLVVDRGKRLGGRMAVNTVTGVPWVGHPVDVGAAYLTASDPAFVTQLDSWLRRGIAREWTDTFAVADPGGIQGSTTGPMRYAAVSGLRSLVEDLADELPIGCEVVSNTEVRSFSRGRSGFEVELVRSDPVRRRWHDADRLALCLPGPQALSILGSGDPTLFPELVTSALSQQYVPILSLWARWPQRAWSDFAGCFVNDHPLLSFIADDGDRRGDGAPVLVAHSSSALAEQHLGEPGLVAEPLLRAVQVLLGITEAPVEVHIRRWALARPQPPHPSPDAELARCAVNDHGAGIAGDAFSDRPRIEAAWLSGTARHCSSRVSRAEASAMPPRAHHGWQGA